MLHVSPFVLSEIEVRARDLPFDFAQGERAGTIRNTKDVRA